MTLVVTDISGMEVTAAGTAPVFHRIPLHRQTDLSVRLLIPWGKITIYFIIVKFMGLNSTSGAYFIEEEEECTIQKRIGFSLRNIKNVSA